MIVIACFGVAYHFHPQEFLRRALVRVQDLGVWGAFLFVALYVAACLALVPGSVLTLGAGAIFGVVKGTLLTSVAATMGATAAFLVGRYLARKWVAKRIGSYESFIAIDEAVAHEGWKIVGLTRLSPIFPFSFLNYAYGLTSVSLRDYVFASFVGMLPGTAAYVYLGSLTKSVAIAGLAPQGQTPLQWALYALGLGATIAVTLAITRIARRALDKNIARSVVSRKPR